MKKAEFVPVRHGTTLANARSCAKATNMAREAALAFLEADENGDGVLEYFEFRTAVQRMRGNGVRRNSDGNLDSEEEEELRNLFKSIDGNGNGTIEMDEYFLWSLDMASKQGCGLVAIFQKYDTSGEGVLDASEFALAVEDLGFSATFAHDLFVELDDDNSGAVSCACAWSQNSPGAALLPHVDPDSQLLQTLLNSRVHVISPDRRRDHRDSQDATRLRLRRVEEAAHIARIHKRGVLVAESDDGRPYWPPHYLWCWCKQRIQTIQRLGRRVVAQGSRFRIVSKAAAGDAPPAEPPTCPTA